MKTQLQLLNITLTFICLMLLAKARAVSPPPDGGYPGLTTAEGDTALNTLTSGLANTAVGWFSLSHVTTGSYNTGVGAGALDLNNGNENTATGVAALLSNTGSDNTANGAFALVNNSTGAFNTAVGDRALQSNTTGDWNTATGLQALMNNTTGQDNTAAGVSALQSNTTGNDNTAVGVNTLFHSTGGGNTAIGSNALVLTDTGSDNTAVGRQALQDNSTGLSNTAIGVVALFNSTTGSSNIAIGDHAAFNITTGDNNIDIGNEGVADDAATIRIGSSQSATYIAGISGQTASGGVPVYVSGSGQLGTLTSSARFKSDIKPMDKSSDAILALKPVTFHYKSDKANRPEFGLVAEQVADVNPDLVVRDKNGEIYTVRYDAINAMLLNEFLKEHKAFVVEQSKVEKLENTVSGLLATVKEQAAQIQKVSAQLKLSTRAPQTVANDP